TVLHVRPLAVPVPAPRPLPRVGDRAGNGFHVTRLPVRRPRPAGQDGHPHRAHRLAAHPRAAGRAARVAADRPPGTHPRGADMTRGGDAELSGTDEVAQSDPYDAGLAEIVAESRV